MRTEKISEDKVLGQCMDSSVTNERTEKDTMQWTSERKLDRG